MEKERISIFSYVHLYKLSIRFDITSLSLFKFFGVHCTYIHDEKLFTNGLISMSVISMYPKCKSVYKPRNFRTERSFSATKKYVYARELFR